ncbi:energy-coupling factor transporter transmembrane protein EcfT [Treponema primitia]|uniref:energy-coupling factor transporter transmembrane component T family protein n=1 Tax=Treponema primitia TaxID=88058 RepID=UPI00397ED9D9
MYLDRFEFKKDLLKGFDGRGRFIAVLFLIASLINSNNELILISAILLCLGFLIREIRVVFSRLLPVNMMALALWLPVFFGVKVNAALLYTLRINAAALLYMCFIIPMSISTVASSLTKLKVPSRLISLFILTYRYIFLMQERFRTAQKAMRLRNPMHNDTWVWRSLSAVFASSLVSAVFRGQKVWTAMLARGFDGNFPVTIAFKWKLRDTALLAASVICSFFVLIY